MKLLKPGQTVLLSEGKHGEPSTRIEGTIRCVNIGADLGIEYQVGWWNEKTMAKEWFAPNQIHELPEADYIDVEFGARKA